MSSNPTPRHRRKRDAASGGRIDRLFQKEPASPADFAFDERTAAVFDDMLARSVPHYDETQQMIVDLVRSHVRAGTHVYDLGCSTGTTLANLGRAVTTADVTWVGVDLSDAMLARARQRLERQRPALPFRLIEADLNAPFVLRRASAVVVNLTLQFVRPPNRPALLQAIHRGLRPGGCLVLIEKVVASDSRVSRLFIERYYDFKRANGYNELEIARKREALENVLVPYTVEENERLLREAGFGVVQEFFRWYNFAGLLAVKSSSRRA